MAFDATDFIPAKVDPLTITDPRERLKYLAGFLREIHPTRFFMGEWANECGSICCIGGWVDTLFVGKAKQTAYEFEATGLLLGLDGAAADALFYPASVRLPGGRRGWDATPRQAAQVIDHLLLTGEVDWGVAS